MLDAGQVEAEADEIAQAIADGEPGVAPVPAQPEGVLYACDVYKHAIAHLRGLLERAEEDDDALLDVFAGRRPSEYMSGWAGGAGERLRGCRHLGHMPLALFGVISNREFRVKTRRLVFVRIKNISSKFRPCGGTCCIRVMRNSSKNKGSYHGAIRSITTL